MKKFIILLFSLFLFGVSTVNAFPVRDLNNSHNYVVLAEEEKENKKDVDGGSSFSIIIMLLLAFVAIAVFIVACKAEDDD